MRILNDIFKPADTVLVFLMKVIIIAVTVLTTGTMLVQVIARYVFEISISGLDELTGHTAVWLYLMGAAYGTYERSQIKAEMMHMFVKNENVLQWTRIVSALVSIVVASFMTVWSWDYIHWSILKHEATPTLRLPAVLFQSAILTGAGLMVVYFAVEFVDRIKDFAASKIKH